jgi:hypothetical protein
MVFEEFKYQMKKVKEGLREENTRKKVFPMNAQINITYRVVYVLTHIIQEWDQWLLQKHFALYYVLNKSSKSNIELNSHHPDF